MFPCVIFLFITLKPNEEKQTFLSNICDKYLYIYFFPAF